MSIVGFDDIHSARLTSPQLTTLRHPAGEIGRHLIRLLLRTIDEPAAAEHVYITPDLVVGESTAPVPS